VQSVAESIWELFDPSWTDDGGGIEAYLETVVRRCGEWFEADGVTLFLQIAGSDTFLLAAQAGIDADLPWSAAFSKGESIAGRVAQTGEALLIEDPRNHPALKRTGLTARRDIGSAVVAPLHALGGCLGVLNISRRSGAKPFNQQDLVAVTRLTSHVALAVANARLLSRLDSEAIRLKTLAERSAATLAGLALAVIAVDANGRVMESNAAARRLLRTRSPLEGMDWDDLRGRLAPALGAAFLKSTRIAAGGKSHKVSVEEGGACYSVIASPTSDGGAVVLVEDVTKQVMAEREIARVSRLAEIGQMTAAIAHEIRNPLTSIRGAAQVLRSERTLSGARAWARVIEDEANSLNGLCDQFLEFARPMALNLRPTDIRLLLDKLLKAMQPDIEPSGVDVNLNLVPRVPIIEVDAEKLAQALRNLIRNALEAMPSGGTLTVDGLIEAGKLHLSVQDTGKGIRQDDMKRLFTPFFTTRPNGTGLGLCNVMRTAEAHGGTVRVESSKSGSKFTISIPARLAESSK
jgi:signal transduction histidine kinase